MVPCLTTVSGCCVGVGDDGGEGIGVLLAVGLSVMKVVGIAGVIGDTGRGRIATSGDIR